MRVRHLLTGSRLTVLLAVSLQTAVLAKRAHADPPSLLGVDGRPAGSTAVAPPLLPSAPARPRNSVTPVASVGIVPGSVIVRSGNHPGYGRLAFDLPGPTDVVVERTGDAIILHFGNVVPSGLAGLMMPRNVHGVQSDAHDITISISSGAEVRSDKTARQLVVDILDPPTAPKEQPSVLSRPVIARVRPASGDLAPAAAPSTSPPTTLPPTTLPTSAHSAPPGQATVESRSAAEKFAQQDLPNAHGQVKPVPLPELTGAEPPRAVETDQPEIVGPVSFVPYPLGSDLGASEPPTAVGRSNLPPNVPKPLPVSTGRPTATPPAQAAAVPPAGLSNAIARPPAPKPVAPVLTTPPTAQVAENPPISAPTLPAPSASPAPSAEPAPVSAAATFPPPPFGAGSDNTNAPNWAVPPVLSSAQPIQTTASLIPVPPQSRGAAITMPFASATGAAALRRGDDAVVIFDENRAIDLSALQNDPVFGSAAIQLLESATVLRLKLPPSSDLRLAKVASGWSLWVGPVGDVSDTGLQTLGSSVSDSKMEFAASLPSKTVVIPDPETGGNLLVGTQHQSGEAVPLPRRTPDFVVLPTLQGVVIEPSSDRPQLQVAPPGFVLSGVDRALALSDNSTLGTAAADAATLSRRFNLQALPLLLLRQSLKNRIDEAAATPPLARLAKRRAVAEAYLALGMGAEAQAMMRLAVMDDPRGSEDPDSIALGAMGAILAERTDQAQAIDDPRITGTDEIRLWRAIRKAQLQEGSKPAAVDFADTDRLVLAYPDLLRDHLLPLVVETEALGGQVARAAAVIDKRKDDPGLLLARAFVLRAQGDTKGALAIFDKLTMGRDRLLRFRSALAALQLRVSTKAMTAADAADAGEKMLYAWRGDDRERDLRFQIAAWRFQAGQWSGALAMLRESAAAFPDLRGQYRRQITETLRGLMRDDRLSQMDPIQLISLLEDNKELLPDGAEGQLAATELADRMAQLDLGQRSEPILARLSKTTPSLPARAAFGLRLAAMRLDAGDPTGAIAALSDSASDGLGPDLTERRAILAARATAASGQVAPAVAALVAIGTPSADLVRASIEETAKDWSGAANALVSYVSRTVPNDGKLSAEQSHVIVRLAAVMAQGSDEAGLAGLRQQYTARMQDSPEASTFKLLTEAPVRDVTDLPRSAKEMAAARTVASPARQ